MSQSRIVMGNTPDGISRLKEALAAADCVVVGAGAGLSTAAGLTYNGERFDRYFADFRDAYGITDMYSGGFYSFPSEGQRWAWWSRHVYVNRYINPPKSAYVDLLSLVQEKNYFVITTNVDHQFQKAGFDKSRLFYTQGDYGLFQCSVPCHTRTYDNKAQVVKMLLAQGFLFGEHGGLELPKDPNGLPDWSAISMEVPESLIPYCPVCGEPMTMNLRQDNSFVEDEGWNEAAGQYQRFIGFHQNSRILFLDLGCGQGTPTIFKYPFMHWTEAFPMAMYACVNLGEAYTTEAILKKSICIDGDLADVLKALKSQG